MTNKREIKTELLSVKLRATDKGRLEKEARALGITLSELVERRVLYGADVRQFAESVVTAVEFQAAALSQPENRLDRVKNFVRLHFSNVEGATFDAKVSAVLGNPQKYGKFD